MRLLIPILILFGWLPQQGAGANALVPPAPTDLSGNWVPDLAEKSKTDFRLGKSRIPPEGLIIVQGDETISFVLNIPADTSGPKPNVAINSTATLPTRFASVVPDGQWVGMTLVVTSADAEKTRTSYSVSGDRLTITRGADVVQMHRVFSTVPKELAFAGRWIGDEQRNLPAVWQGLAAAAINNAFTAEQDAKQLVIHRQRMENAVRFDATVKHDSSATFSRWVGRNLALTSTTHHGIVEELWSIDNEAFVMKSIRYPNGRQGLDETSLFFIRGK